MPFDPAHALRQSLVSARTAAGISQAALAAAIGTSQSAISELESGAVDARLSTLARWASGLGLTLAAEPGPVAGDACGAHLLDLPTGLPVRLSSDALVAAHRAPLTAVVGAPGTGPDSIVNWVRDWCYSEARTLLEVPPGHPLPSEAGELAPGSIVVVASVVDLDPDSLRRLQVLARMSRKNQIGVFVFGARGHDFHEVEVPFARVICLGQSAEDARTTMGVFGIDPLPARVAMLTAARLGAGLLRDVDGAVHAVCVRPLPDLAT